MKKLFFLPVLFFFIFLSFTHYSAAQVVNSESFDGTTFPPAGWTSSVVDGGTNWARSTTTYYPSGYFPHSGAGMAYYDCYDTYPPGHALLISPLFTLVGRGTSPDSVVFWLFRGNTYSGAYDSLTVLVNTTASQTGATQIGSQLIYSATNGWLRYAYAVPASFTGATNYIILKSVSAWYNDVYLDDVQWTSYPPTPPPVPALVRPVNHAIGRPLYDTLQWTASSGATNYNLQIALDSLFTTMVFNDTTMTGTSYTIGQFNPLTNWWWRVKAKNAAGWSAFTTQWTFKTMGAATGVTLYLPANNAVNQAITNLQFKWSHAVDQTAPFKIGALQTGALTVSNYWYALYTDTTIAPVVVDSTLTDTTKTVSGLLNNTNYWWKVRAKNNVGYGPFSVYFKFTTVVAVPPAPTNVAPANHSIVYTPSPLIDWTSVAGATSYRMQLSTDSTFTTVFRDSTVTVDSVRITGLANTTKYFWHVRAQNAGGNSAWTTSWDFTTNLSGISGNENEIPKVFKLYNNYPNPFNPVSTIKFDIPEQSDVKIIIYDAIGQEVFTLVNSHFAPGAYSVQWNALNYPSGVYFYKITAGKFTDIHKMVLIK